MRTLPNGKSPSKTDIQRLRWERQSELDNEIEDIIALRDEYKQLIKTMLDLERAKDHDKQDQQERRDYSLSLPSFLSRERKRGHQSISVTEQNQK